MKSHREKVPSEKKRERAKNLMLTFCGWRSMSMTYSRVERRGKEIGSK